MNEHEQCFLSPDDLARRALRQAHAVSETQRLRKMYLDGDMPRDLYLGHLKRLRDYILDGTELPAEHEKTRKISGVRLRGPTLDELLIGYLLGFDAHDDLGRKKHIGNL